MSSSIPIHTDQYHDKPIILKYAIVHNQLSTSEIEHPRLNQFPIPILASRTIAGIEIDCFQFVIGCVGPTEFPVSVEYK